MPLFHTHIRFNVLLALPFWLLLFAFFFPIPKKSLYAFSLSFLYASFFFHPDLDLAHKTKLFSVKGILTFPFRSYSLFFRHRGISHHPLLGTLSRVVWMIGFLVLLRYLFFQGNTPKGFTYLLEKKKSFLPFIFLGFFSADLSHIGLDFLFSKKKRR